MTHRLNAPLGLLAITLLAGGSGCIGRGPTPEWQNNATGQWTVCLVAVADGFSVPASAYVDVSNGHVYVSNIETATGQFWADDASGFISKLAPGGAINQMRWCNSTPTSFISAPKGMCILNGRLYVADNRRLLRIDLATPAGPEIIDVPDSRKLNDLATDGSAVYACDGATSKIYRIDGAAITAIDAPRSVHGITFSQGALLAVTWDTPDVYTVDPTGAAKPIPMGLTDTFDRLGSVEVLYDGTLIVSDFAGDALYAITPDGRDVKKLAALDAPGDIAIDRQRGLLYVPQFMANRVAVYKLVPDTGAASLSAE